MTGFSRFEKGICMIFWHSSIFSGLSTSAYLKKARIAASLWLRVEMLFPRSLDQLLETELHRTQLTQILYHIGRKIRYAQALCF